MDNNGLDYELLEIGSVVSGGNRLGILKRFRRTSSRDLRFEGFFLEGDRTMKAGDDNVRMSVMIPREAVDCLCGLLQAELAAQERAEKITREASALRW